MLIVVFAVQFRLFAAVRRRHLDKLILPAITLASGSSPFWRASRARACSTCCRGSTSPPRARKGCTGKWCCSRHALRNTMIPIVTLIGLEMGALLGGAVVTENVFAWPGIGQLVVSVGLQP